MEGVRNNFPLSIDLRASLELANLRCAAARRDCLCKIQPLNER